MLRNFSGDDVHAALDYPSLIDALREAFRQGGEPMPVRQAYDVGFAGAPAHLLTMPAWQRGQTLGVKLVTVFPQNAARGLGAVSSLYVLFDGETGVPRAMIDGEALTNRRTAAASALASSYLSRPDSSTLLMVGTGHLAHHLPPAHAAVRPIDKVLVWGRNGERAAALAATLQGKGLAATAVGDLDVAIAQADIVSCATTSTQALVRGRLLRPGTHVDLVGAFTPQMRECDDNTMLRAAVYVDTRAGALKEAGDILQPMAAGLLSADAIRGDLHDLASGAVPGRRDEAEITVFKSVGAAIEDLTAASLLVRA
ncbi:ornithine cyclodeaminase family protein [Undibacter mobilis]|uniref:ornithine cyclodeaminase family protein n=1 Tax=Undibacter mobilis TaxID=2292256 RepID=UPI001FDF8934|nr:ornithine cyclodeaminase family protein [Undibacter mobilis]